jgi:O-acetyl-ADP-ribose deacetylase (regulator of RNase III)
MRWTVTHGNILDTRADVLVCSANVFLNLSGGVGGEILLRHGDAMQKELHSFLAAQRKRFVERGDIVATPPCGTRFNAVIHAVAVDGFYRSSPGVIEEVVRKSLAAAAALGARTVALTALATGYGRLTMAQFAQGMRPLMEPDFPPIQEVILCVRNENDRNDLAAALSRGAGAK